MKKKAATRSRERPTGICRLCLAQRQLCHSHILPELVFRPSYDKSGRTMELEFDGQNRFVQQGYREYLLCEECEARFQRWEDYFARAWRRRLPKIVRPNEVVLVTGLDYAKLKLCILSFLWRASVSTLPEFEPVRLGPHEERLRSILLEERVPRRDQYAVTAAVLYWPAGIKVPNPSSNVIWEVVQPFGRTRMHGHWIYMGAFYACVWSIFVSRHAELATDQLTLSESGEMALLPLTLAQFGFARRVLENRMQAERKGGPS